jgi:hypothetical protein
MTLTKRIKNKAKSKFSGKKNTNMYLLVIKIAGRKNFTKQIVLLLIYNRAYTAACFRQMHPA